MRAWGFIDCCQSLMQFIHSGEQSKTVLPLPPALPETVSVKKSFGPLLLFVIVLLPAFAQGQDIEDLIYLPFDDLMNVKVISAEKHARSVDEIPASVVVIQQDEIARYGYQSLGEILEHVPGLFGIDDWFMLGMHFGVRGFYDAFNRNIVFMVNGVRQSEFIFGGSHLPLMNVPVAAIRKIEVVRGPMSVHYGTGAFFGAINVITYENDSAYADVSAALGSNGTHKLTAATSFQEGALQLYCGAALSSTDGPVIDYSHLGPDLRPGKINGLLAEENRYFHVAGTRGALAFDLSYNETSSGKTLFFQPDEDYDGLLWGRQLRFGMSHSHAVSEALKTTVKLQYSYFNNEMDYDLGLMPDAWEMETSAARYLEIEADSRWEPGPDFLLTLGGNYNAAYDCQMITDAPGVGFSRAMTDTEGDEIATFGFYAQAKWRINPALMFIVGGRAEKRSDFQLRFMNNAHMQYIDPDTLLNMPPWENHRHMAATPWDVSPQVAVIWKRSDKLLVKGLYGQAVNRSNFFMLYNMVRNTESPLLTPERISTLELNLLAVLHRHLSLGLSLYRNNLTDLIIRSAGVNSQGDYYTYHDNGGKMVTRGVELQLQYAPSDQLGVDMAFTLQNTEDPDNPEMEVAYSPQSLAVMKAHWRNHGGFSLALIGDYVDEMSTQFDQTLANPADPGAGPIGRIGDAVPHRFTVGLNIRQESLLGSAFYANLRVSNLLDSRQYYPVAFYSTWTQKGTLTPGRTLLFTLGWQPRAR